MVSTRIFKFMIIFHAVLFQIFFGSCVAPFHCVKGYGDAEERSFELEEFRSFMVSCSADVEIAQGDKQQVTVRGESNILDMFNTDVKNGSWNIDTDKCYSSKKGVKVMITMPDLESIKINGSGDVSSLGILSTKDISIEINGSGDVALELNSDEVRTEIDGSGDVTLSGECHSMDIDVNGSGDIKAFGLNTGDCDVDVNGSGDTRLNISGHMKVNVNGSGDVHYKGAPTSLEVNENGSGDVRNAN